MKANECVFSQSPNDCTGLGLVASMRMELLVVLAFILDSLGNMKSVIHPTLMRRVQGP